MNKVQNLYNTNGEVNTMTSVFAFKLGLKVCYTNIKAQKIDSSTFKTFKIVLTSF